MQQIDNLKITSLSQQVIIQYSNNMKSIPKLQNSPKQQMPSPTKSNNTATKSQISKCNCMIKLNTFSQQIMKINDKIKLLFKLIEVTDHNINANDTQDRCQNNQDDRERKKREDNVIEESLLLDGLEADDFGCGKEGFYGYGELKQLQVGKSVAEIRLKIKEIQQKSEYIVKFKNNFSILTKIVQQIQIKMQSEYSKINRLETELEQSHRRDSNCSIEQQERKTMQTIQKQKRSKKQIFEQNDLKMLNMLPTRHPRKSLPLKAQQKSDLHWRKT